MATKKIAQGTHAPKKRAEQPVSEGIRRAAEKIGAAPSQGAKAPQGDPAEGTREHYEQFAAKQEALASTPFTMTLAEACDLVGRDLSPNQFQSQVFDVLARELDVLSDLANTTSGFEGWCAFQNLSTRIQLAGKIMSVIGGAS